MPVPGSFKTSGMIQVSDKRVLSRERDLLGLHALCFVKRRRSSMHCNLLESSETERETFQCCEFTLLMHGLQNIIKFSKRFHFIFQKN